jgi:hypothetical protein
MVLKNCHTLPANPNRSEGQIKASGRQLVDPRPSPLLGLVQSAGSQPAIATGSGKTVCPLVLAPRSCHAAEGC